jgi:hypothetical protein
MADLEVGYSRLDAASSYKLVRSDVAYVEVKSSTTYIDLSTSEVVLDYDTKNRYFRDESVTLGDVAALTPEKNFTESVGTVADVLQSVGVNKNVVDDFSIGDFAYVLFTIQRQFADSTALSDSSTLIAGINRYEVLDATDTYTYTYSKPLADSTAASDASVIGYDFVKSETINASDLFARTVTYSRAFNDTITLDDFTDVDAITKSTTGNKSNALSFTDIKTYAVDKNLFESPVVTDIYASVFVTSRADTLSVAESISVVNRSLLPSRLNAGTLNTATLNN